MGGKADADAGGNADADDEAGGSADVEGGNADAEAGGNADADVLGWREDASARTAMPGAASDDVDACMEWRTGETCGVGMRGGGERRGGPAVMYQSVRETWQFERWNGQRGKWGGVEGGEEEGKGKETHPHREYQTAAP